MINENKTAKPWLLRSIIKPAPLNLSIITLLSSCIPLSGIILTEAPFTWIASCITINIGFLVFFLRTKPSYLRRALTVTFLMLVSLLDVLFLVSYYFQNTGFNDAFMYHIDNSLKYSGFQEHAVLSIILVSYLFAMLLLSVSLSKTQISITNKTVWICTLALITGLFISPPIGSFISCISTMMASTTAHADFTDFKELTPTQAVITANTVVKPQTSDMKKVNGGVVKRSKAALPSIEFTGARKPNVVLIYAESLDSQYFDESVFPDLLPELDQVKKDSLFFTNVQQGVGAGWTIAGIVASQCGYPLSSKHEVSGNNYSLFNKFMPRAVCLGDLLKRDGYRLTFIGGADERFAGKGNFLRSHGYSKIIDKQTFVKDLADKAYLNQWGAFDDTVFEKSYKEFKSMSEKKRPFMLTILTMDTHHPKGFLSKSCSAYGAGDNSSLNSVHCSNTLISQFINKIRKSKYSKGTQIIVVSDHLAMRNTASEKLSQSQEPRTLTFFINSPNGKKGKNMNAGLHYDIAPTILDAIGYSLDGQIGFGASLLAGPGYLPKKFGENTWQSQTENLIAISNNLWKQDVTINEAGITFYSRSVNIGSIEFDLSSEGLSDFISSTFFIFDLKGHLKTVKSFPYSQELSTEALRQILLPHKDDMVLAAGYAGNLPGLCDKSESKDQACFFFGKPDSKAVITGPLDGKTNIDFDSIQVLTATTTNPSTPQ